MTEFQINDPSLESQWRAIILFGKNSATYKFSFAKSLLELANRETTRINLSDLAIPFSRNIVEHLKVNDKQGSSKSSSFLNHCRDFITDRIKESELFYHTEKLGFVNVIDAFQNVNGGNIPSPFYEKDFSNGNKQIIITDELLKLKENFHFQNFDLEVDARWNLVETAWNLQISPSLLEVKYDESKSLFFIENDFLKRIDVTSVRDALNGYQKGKCFYSFKNISINSKSITTCDVDHFLPHLNKSSHFKNNANINGVWNLVLASSSVNRSKNAKIPELRFLNRLFNRNEFYISSKHPLAETIINQTGRTKNDRRKFLELQYNIALSNSIQTWKPEHEQIGTF
ncbi:HNH endonuclease [Flavobacteriaceae bacterium KMM 6898]|nr:HNH endonuclease [Flavobacteriaceae bacterium KMM 6898]